MKRISILRCMIVVATALLIAWCVAILPAGPKGASMRATFPLFLEQAKADTGGKRGDRPQARYDAARELLGRSMEEGREVLVALPLIASDREEDRLRAERIFLRRIRAGRERVGFLTIDLIIALRLFPDHFTKPGRKRVHSWLEHIIRSRDEITSYEFVHANDNWGFLSSFVLILGGEMVSQSDSVQEGIRRLESWLDLNRKLGASSEFNSPVYTSISMSCLRAIGAHAESLRARVVARTILHRLWAEVALRYHAPTSQFAAPHARSAPPINLALPSPMLYAVTPLLESAPSLDENSFASVRRNFGRIAEDEFSPAFLSTDLRSIFEDKSYPREVSALFYRPALITRHFTDPAGLGEAVTYLTTRFSIGSATRTYGRGEKTTPFGAYWVLRAGDENSVKRRSLFSRYVVDEHAPGDLSSRTYPEFGHFAAAQDRDLVLIVQVPRPDVAGRVKRLASTLYITLPAGSTDPKIVVNGKEGSSGRFPRTVEVGNPIYLDDGDTFVGIHSYSSPGLDGDARVLIERLEGFLAISVLHLDSDQPRRVTTAQLGQLFAGFAIRMGDTSTIENFDTFRKNDSSVGLSARLEDGVVSIGYESPARSLEVTSSLKTPDSSWSKYLSGTGPIDSDLVAVSSNGLVELGSIRAKADDGSALMLTRSAAGRAFTVSSGSRHPSVLTIDSPYGTFESDGFGVGRIHFDADGGGTLEIDNARSTSPLRLTMNRPILRVIVNDRELESKHSVEGRWEVPLPSDPGEPEKSTQLSATVQLDTSVASALKLGALSVRIENYGPVPAREVSAAPTLLGPVRPIGHFVRTVRRIEAGAACNLRWPLAGTTEGGPVLAEVTVTAANAPAVSASVAANASSRGVEQRSGEDAPASKRERRKRTRRCD